MKKINSILPALGAFLVLAAPAVMAQTTLFFDDFNGSINSAWQASMPNFNEAPGGFASYIGAPAYSFQTLGGSSVLNMNSSMSDQQRSGWLTSTVFNAPGGFIYETRFNTLTLSKTTSIDAFVELSIFNSANHNAYDVASPFAGSYADHPNFAAGSSIDNSYNSQPYAFQNNTWYDLLIEALPGQNVQVLLENDGGTILASQTLNHTLSAYGSGFQLGLSQALGNPLGTYNTDVDVDYVKLIAVPEPSSVALAVIGFASLFVLARKRQPVA
jgi:hypothetical protein